MTELEKVRKFFEKDRYATDNGAYIEEVGDHYAKCCMELNEHHKNAVGGIMGGVYFTLADFTFAVATNWQEPGTVSITGDISFIGTPKGTKLISETELIKNGNTISCYNVRITDEFGTPVAAVKMVGYRKQQ